jgi:hypothetical protein
MNMVGFFSLTGFWCLNAAQEDRSPSVPTAHSFLMQKGFPVAVLLASAGACNVWEGGLGF